MIHFKLSYTLEHSGHWYTLGWITNISAIKKSWKARPVSFESWEWKLFNGTYISFILLLVAKIFGYWILNFRNLTMEICTIGCDPDYVFVRPASMTLMIAALIVSGIPLQLYHIIIITFELVWSTLVNHYDPFQIIVYFGTLWSLVHIGIECEMNPIQIDLNGIQKKSWFFGF